MMLDEEPHLVTGLMAAGTGAPPKQRKRPHTSTGRDHPPCPRVRRADTGVEPPAVLAALFPQAMGVAPDRRDARLLAHNGSARLEQGEWRRPPPSRAKGPDAFTPKECANHLTNLRASKMRRSGPVAA